MAGEENCTLQELMNLVFNSANSTMKSSEPTPKKIYNTEKLLNILDSAGDRPSMAVKEQSSKSQRVGIFSKGRKRPSEVEQKGIQKKQTKLELKFAKIREFIPKIRTCKRLPSQPFVARHVKIKIAKRRVERRATKSMAEVSSVARVIKCVTIKPEIIDLTVEPCICLHFALVGEVSDLEETTTLIYQQAKVEDVPNQLVQYSISVPDVQEIETETVHRVSEKECVQRLLPLIQRYRTLAKIQESIHVTREVNIDFTCEDYSNVLEHMAERFHLIGSNLCRELSHIKIPNFDIHRIIKLLTEKFYVKYDIWLEVDQIIWYLYLMLQKSVGEHQSEFLIKFYSQLQRILTENSLLPQVFTKEQLNLLYEQIKMYHEIVKFQSPAVKPKAFLDDVKNIQACTDDVIIVEDEGN